MLVVESPADLYAHVGDQLGVTDWIEMTQDRVVDFAECTEDRQWIHVDPDRAAGSPFGTTIAHGFLTLSLTAAMLGELLTVTGSPMTVNYGLDRVRFPAPVPTGSRVRGAGVLSSVTDVAGGVQAVVSLTVEVDGQQDKPVCVADMLVRVYS